VNVRENIVSESPRSNLGPKKVIDNEIARLSRDPNAVVESTHDPAYQGSATTPRGVTHYVTKDGKLVRAETTLNKE
jgi:hypothetical protein